MASDNISPGSKWWTWRVLHLGCPAPAVILSDFGADVIKVEPPNATSGGMDT